MRNFKTTAPFAHLKGRAAAEIHVAVRRTVRIINESVADGGACENPQTRGRRGFQQDWQFQRPAGRSGRRHAGLAAVGRPHSAPLVLDRIVVLLRSMNCHAEPETLGRERTDRRDDRITRDDDVALRNGQIDLRGDHVGLRVQDVERCALTDIALLDDAVQRQLLRGNCSTFAATLSRAAIYCVQAETTA